MNSKRAKRLIPIGLINACLNLENLGDLEDLEKTGYLSDLAYSGFMSKEWVGLFEKSQGLSDYSKELIKEYSHYKALSYHYIIPNHLDSIEWQALRARLGASDNITLLDLSRLICPFLPLANIREIIKKSLVRATFNDDLVIATYPANLYNRTAFEKASLQEQLEAIIYLGSFSYATEHSLPLKDYHFASLIWRGYLNQKSRSNTPDNLPIPWLFKDYKSTPSILEQALEAAYRLHRKTYLSNPTKPQDLFKFFNPNDLDAFIVWRNNQTIDKHVRLKLIDNRPYDYDRFRQLFEYWITV